VSISDPTLFGFALIYAITAIGVHLTFATGMLSLAYGGFMQIGACAAAIMTSKHGQGLLVSLLVSLAISSAVAGLVVLPMLRARGIHFGLLTFGFTLLVNVIVINWTSLTNGPNGIPVARQASLTDILIVLIIVVLFVAVTEASVHGLAMRAIEQDEHVARAQGIHVRRYMISVFIVSAAITGLGGGLLAEHTYFVSPDQFGFTLTLQILLFVVVGGAYRWYGALVGAFFLSYLSNYLNSLINWQMIIEGAILAAVVVLLPRGLGGLLTDGSDLITRLKSTPGGPSFPVRSLVRSSAAERSDS
jgi:branched-chain amino acid transport system permease protein